MFQILEFFEEEINIVKYPRLVSEMIENLGQIFYRSPTLCVGYQKR